jgi:hypothetical protein
MLSAIPSVTAIAIETCFVDADILNSILICAACKRSLAHWPDMFGERLK